jgi:A/G-specific adenine glycosylase
MPSPQSFHAALLPWFAQEARDLPWRRTRDPYAIWISETMLQQTRVEAVIDHYTRFLARFPTVASLADASEDDVLAQWSGLGYYRRARALRTAAREIEDEHDGVFPCSLDAARALTGVGPYTAGAVLSIAYGLPAPAVDGNVARVFARWFELDSPVGSSALIRELWRRAGELLHREDPGAWNQALMELGARVCTPKSPACEACPVALFCGARAAGRAHELPVPAAKRAVVDVLLEVALVERDGAVLLEQRPRTGRMAGLWELPTREINGARLWPADYGVDLREGAPLGEVAHSITNHRIRARVRAAGVATRAGLSSSSRFVALDAVGELGLTGMAKKILSRFAAEPNPALRPASRRR